MECGRLRDDLFYMGSWWGPSGHSLHCTAKVDLRARPTASQRMLSKWVTQSSVSPGRCDVSSRPEPKLFMATVSALIPGTDRQLLGEHLGGGQRGEQASSSGHGGGYNDDDEQGPIRLLS